MKITYDMYKQLHTAAHTIHERAFDVERGYVESKEKLTKIFIKVGTEIIKSLPNNSRVTFKENYGHMGHLFLQINGSTLVYGITHGKIEYEFHLPNDTQGKLIKNILKKDKKRIDGIIKNKGVIDKGRMRTTWDDSKRYFHCCDPFILLMCSFLLGILIMWHLYFN